MTAHSSAIKLVYIMGAGRSGSTILDIVLGNHPEIESVGELVKWPVSGWINNEYCACGHRANDCAYWTQIRQAWSKSTGENDILTYMSQQDLFTGRLIPYLRLFREWSRSSAEFKRYAEQTYALLDAIHLVSNKSIIVDSSKYPERAFLLSMMPNIDLYLIHLVRDGRGVAWSLQKSFKKNDKVGVQKEIKSGPVWRAAMFWTVTNLQSAWVLRQVPAKKSIRLRYEDLVNQPQQTLTKIENLLKVDLTTLVDAIMAGSSFTVGHNISGNRLRMAGSVSFRADTEWQKMMPRRQQKIFYMLTGPLLRRFGYIR